MLFPTRIVNLPAKWEDRSWKIASGLICTKASPMYA
jgi:hypothetical protein